MSFPQCHLRRWHLAHILSLIVFCSLLLSACSLGGKTTTGSSGLSANQVLSFPLLGTVDLSSLDPTREANASMRIVFSMLYSGLVRTDKDMHVVPDQATWQISSDQTVYTFTLHPDLTFADGTPVTAQSYVYSWTRALSSSYVTSDAISLTNPIRGASAMVNGQATQLSGVRALNAQTLQITLNQPTPYFLASLTNPLFYPVNQKDFSGYDPIGDPHTTHSYGLGSGPFIIQDWVRNVKLVLVPNKRYAGQKIRISAVNLYFVTNPHVAYEKNAVGSYDFIWGVPPEDMEAVRGLPTTQQVSQLQTDVLFFNSDKPPFNVLAVRQAFARAIDKKTMIQAILDGSVIDAETVIPAVVPDFSLESQQDSTYNANQARTLLHSVYPKQELIPPVVFSYPITLLPLTEAQALQQMWQQALGIRISLLALNDDAYMQEMQEGNIQLGFSSWQALYPDPYAFLTLFSAAGPDFSLEQSQSQAYATLLNQAEQTSGANSVNLYSKAEQFALAEGIIFPLDHQTTTAVIPVWLHGVSVNGNGLYFGDWSDVYLMAH